MSAAPTPTRRTVRWGLGDVVWVWFVGLVAGSLAGTITLAIRGRASGLDPDGIDLAVGLIAQNGAILLALVGLSRSKGRSSLHDDFGLALRGRDWPWLAAGVLLQVLAIGAVELLQQIGPGLPEQQAAETVSHSQGPEIVLVVLGVALLAPLVEELLFRGLLLRALLRRTTPVRAVTISAVVFAAAHLLDPSTATLMAPLLLLAVISGIRAVRTGNLSQSIMLHVGFNLLSAILLLWA
ncbi:MAG TPA: CPBP family intramembrane glutamic endopeptidase [Acidimicrobiia bacterium]